MISPQVLDQIKKMFPEFPEEIIMDKIQQVLEQHPDTSEQELIQIAGHFRQLMMRDKAAKLAQLKKMGQ